MKIPWTLKIRSLFASYVVLDEQTGSHSLIKKRREEIPDVLLLSSSSIPATKFIIIRINI